MSFTIGQEVRHRTRLTFGYVQDIDEPLERVKVRWPYGVETWQTTASVGPAEEVEKEARAAKARRAAQAEADEKDRLATIARQQALVESLKDEESPPPVTDEVTVTVNEVAAEKKEDDDDGPGTETDGSA